ncbi:AAA family ATPase [Paenibacillus lycopersici]|uniref:AAA family ATPase n=1 Tax=Paenibacillus lycopersici TaxID=2704462 RepID=A0A6C0FVN7_9BACL|nr:AAA family ATPase [Paenibacillus lycopersici]QHT61218.1 AAA family ATPase [Paenibacillus lycopersici]
MLKPYLIIVTGRPGSGKTTFSKVLGNEIWMPVISRDQIKEGYVHTFARRHSELPEESNLRATEIFFDTLMGLIANQVSVIAEAAFQHRIWSTRLEPFMGKAQVKLCLCKVDGKVALDRFVRRGLDNPLREYFHGDKGIDMARKGMAPCVSPYEEPRLDVPTFAIDTSGEYSPSIKELSRKIFGSSCDLH